MNPKPFIFRTLTLFFFALTLSLATSAIASDCWVELYQENDYTGAHIRLNGPVRMANLRDVQGENWESRIDSLKVGPKANLKVYENTDFKLTLKEMAKYPDLLKSLGLTEQDALEDSERIFIANSKIHDLSDFNFHNKIKSLVIDCVQ